ncbi:condensation domain-containing protein [Nocardia sp. CDC159]|uniref:Condensation domain-containing protein n=1 Tax=Nocardia pulmonis TaxID=2951408 RepID=A0A9X2E1L8_9NOCA|nr:MULTISPECIES: condensation domain-containing protein [Nocardia]MCM6772352.1 condensation domain-containing protein [Nocardia pulmonis]MCM6784990.1 condensation domain-containing protein [Nocardia sp. CDC159]
MGNPGTGVWAGVGGFGATAVTTPLRRVAAVQDRPPASVPLAAPAAVPRPRHIPIAPAQERIWAAARVGRSGDWNVARAWRIRGGEVNPAALASAVADVVARHAPLRTRYRLTEHGPAQVVAEPGGARADIAVAAITEDELAARVRECARAELDLVHELPLRARVFVLGERDVVLALTIHHIAVDGRSVAPLVRDLTTAYRARCAGRAPRFAPLPVDYIDYTLWKHAQLGDYADPWSRASAQLRYWANALVGRPSPLAFPYDRPRPARPDTEGALVPVAFDAAVQRGLLERARRARASVFMVLQAAFALCVGDFARCPDVTVATAVAGREHRVLDELVGNFADDVLMRVRLDRCADAGELLEQVRRVALAAFAHPDTPNPRLERCLPQDAEHPLFQATLILQRGVVHGPGRAVPAIDEIATGVTIAKHDLEFALTELYHRDGTPAGITGSLCYPTALFDPATATAFVRRFMATVDLLAGGYDGGLRSLLAAARDR